MVFERKLELPELALDVIHDRAGISSIHVDGKVKVARDVLMFDATRTRHDPRLRYLPKTHRHIKRCVNEQILNVRQAAACLWGAPHHHVEYLLFLKQAADLDTIQQR